MQVSLVYDGKQLISYKHSSSSMCAETERNYTCSGYSQKITTKFHVFFTNNNPDYNFYFFDDSGKKLTDEDLKKTDGNITIKGFRKGDGKEQKFLQASLNNCTYTTLPGLYDFKADYYSSHPEYTDCYVTAKDLN